MTATAATDQFAGVDLPARAQVRRTTGGLIYAVTARAQRRYIEAGDRPDQWTLWTFDRTSDENFRRAHPDPVPAAVAAAWLSDDDALREHVALRWRTGRQEALQIAADAEAAAADLRAGTISIAEFRARMLALVGER